MLEFHLQQAPALLALAVALLFGAIAQKCETGGGIGEGSYKTKWDTFTYDATSCFGAWGYGSWWNEWDFGLFNGVIAANLLIDKLAGCNLNADFVNSISAEARFYRAIFYYHLFMGYEQFPLIKHYLAASEMYSVAKGTREEIYEFMMGDLDDEVTKYLPQRSVTQQPTCPAARTARSSPPESSFMKRSS